MPSTILSTVKSVWSDDSIDTAASNAYGIVEWMLILGSLVALVVAVFLVIGPKVLAAASSISIPS